ncbi:hypothetical protein D3C85_1823450 [compost metagenome]
MLCVRTLTETPIPNIISGMSRALARLGPDTSPRTKRGTQMIASGPTKDSHRAVLG